MDIARMDTILSVQIYGKGPCLRCRNHYRDADGRLCCVPFQGRIPKDILTAEVDCQEFKRPEKR